MIGPPKDMKKEATSPMSFPTIKRVKAPPAAPYHHFYEFYKQKMHHYRERKGDRSVGGSFIKGGRTRNAKM